MISILIPTYNDDVTTLVALLHSQIKEHSIIAEIIIIDDCSTNATITQKNQQVVKDLHYIYTVNSTNLGRTATRNTLAQKATYPWLLFLDADIEPVKNTFLATYLKLTSSQVDVVCGGVVYKKEKPPKDQSLRWTYGHKRETKSATQRMKTPYTVVSPNMLIKKSVFLQANTAITNNYGLDILFSHNLKMMKAQVLHIDNPVYHLGLEANSLFIKKSLQSVQTTCKLEQKSKMDMTARPLQQSYARLQKLGLLTLFQWFVALNKQGILKNLDSKNPSLFWFDVYRLHYYINLKRDA